MFGRSIFYVLAVALFWTVAHFFGWAGVAVLFAFAIGWHLCFRLVRGHWMPPED
jgi:hypothetical protein